MSGDLPIAMPITMSSKEIAELTEKRHDNVMRDIRKMMSDMPEPGALKIEAFKIRDLTGESVSHYVLPKRETVILVSGYDVRLRARIIDRLEKLEAERAKARALPDFTDPDVLMAHLLEQTRGRIEDQRRAAEAEQGKAVAEGKLSRLAGATGSMCITDAAKTLGIKRARDLFDKMSQAHWIFKRPGNATWLAYQDKLQSGLMEHDDHLFTDGEGRERVRTRALVTAKGLVKLTELFERPSH